MGGPLKVAQWGLQYGVRGAAEDVVRAAMEGLEEAAADVFALAQHRVPVLDPAQESRSRPSGELKATGKVEMDPENLRAAISYGTAYAVYQHERLDLAHPTGGQAKFLESSLIEKRQRAAEIIAAKIREVVGD